MTAKVWKQIWKEFHEWYVVKSVDPEWEEQQKKIEELVEKYK